MEHQRNTFTGLCRVVMRHHGAFLFLIGLYCLAVELVAVIYGVGGSVVLSLYSFDLLDNLKWFCALFIIGHTVYVMVVIHPCHLIRYLKDEWRYKILQPKRLCNAVIVIVALPLFMSAFSSLKTIIPVLNPTLHDALLTEIDAFIHGGRLPWQYLTLFLRQPIISFNINLIYNIWVFVLPAILLWQTFTLENEFLRMQFLLSYLLLWILLGSVMATLLASVGPCYFGEVVEGINPYIGLMQYLGEAQKQYPMWALEMQQVLWEGYQAGEVTRGSGVSAMPSLHVASATLFALLGLQTNRIMGIVLSAFCGMIFIGSVSLGWHYAIDGYVAFILTIVIWRGVGWFVARDQRYVVE